MKSDNRGMKELSGVMVMSQFLPKAQLCPFKSHIFLYMFYPIPRKRKKTKKKN